LTQTDPAQGDHPDIMNHGRDHAQVHEVVAAVALFGAACTWQTKL
jgi:hypothetical protein